MSQAGGGEYPERRKLGEEAEAQEEGRSLAAPQEGQSGVWVHPRGSRDLEAGFEFGRWWGQGSQG